MPIRILFGFCFFSRFGLFGCFFDGCVVLAVDALDGGAFETDAGSVPGRFENEGIVLDVDDSADDTADGGNLIADGEAVSHSGRFLFLLSLRADHEDIHDDQKNGEKQKGQQVASVVCAGRCRACFEKHGVHIEHGKFSFLNRMNNDLCQYIA